MDLDQCGGAAFQRDGDRIAHLEFPFQVLAGADEFNVGLVGERDLGHLRLFATAAAADPYGEHLAVRGNGGDGAGHVRRLPGLPASVLGERHEGLPVLIGPLRRLGPLAWAGADTVGNDPCSRGHDGQGQADRARDFQLGAEHGS